MPDVTAPYNFVPLSPHVCEAADLGLPTRPSQDSPEGGESGFVDITLTCDTPLLVNWGEPRVFEQVGEKQIAVKTCGRAPCGTPAIPGSTLRGLIRNVVEIAAFGKMAFVDDARVGVRDLYAKLDYTDKITTGTRDSGYLPLSQAGWLRFENGAWRLTPCSFGRIDHNDLSDLSKDFKKRVLNCIKEYKSKAAKPPDSKDMSKAQNVEMQFCNGGKRLSHELWVQGEIARHNHSQPLRYRRVATEKAAAERSGNVPAIRKRGTLVFTGMPSDKKHMEFFFFDERPNQTFEVPSTVWSGFLDVHERQEKPSPTWVWRKAALARGEAIPVFYLTDHEGAISRLGLAMMFKMAADRSIGEMIDNTSKDHRGSKVDLAEAIFGRLESCKNKGDGWRGRVSFGWAMAEADSWSEPVNEDKRVILAKPKPSFTPTYVRQRDFSGADGRELLTIGHTKANYRSYMNWVPPPSEQPITEEIRGWKRYPVRPEPEKSQDEKTDNKTQNQIAMGDSASILRPLRPVEPEKGRPLTFSFRLRYHNLHKVELGALLWAITWGGEEKLRHALGMGRPLGWGQVKMSVTLNLDQSSARTAFTEAMEHWAKHNRIPGGWGGSVQIRQLKAMADPEIGKTQRGLLTQMLLRPDHTDVNERNHFLNAKKAGKVLPEYAGLTIPDMGRPIPSPTPKHAASYAGRRRQHQNATQRTVAYGLCDGERVAIESEEPDGYMVRFPNGDIEFVSRSEVDLEK